MSSDCGDYNVAFGGREILYRPVSELLQLGPDEEVTAKTRNYLLGGSRTVIRYVSTIDGRVIREIREQPAGCFPSGHRRRDLSEISIYRYDSLGEYTHPLTEAVVGGACGVEVQYEMVREFGPVEKSGEEDGVIRVGPIRSVVMRIVQLRDATGSNLECPLLLERRTFRRPENCPGYDGPEWVEALCAFPSGDGKACQRYLSCDADMICTSDLGIGRITGIGECPYTLGRPPQILDLSEIWPDWVGK